MDTGKLFTAPYFAEIERFALRQIAPPRPPKWFWDSSKMAGRNAKRSISAILLKNRGLWTVYRIQDSPD